MIGGVFMQLMVAQAMEAETMQEKTCIEKRLVTTNNSSFHSYEVVIKNPLKSEINPEQMGFLYVLVEHHYNKNYLEKFSGKSFLEMIPELGELSIEFRRGGIRSVTTDEFDYLHPIMEQQIHQMRVARENPDKRTPYEHAFCEDENCVKVLEKIQKRQLEGGLKCEDFSIITPVVTIKTKEECSDLGQLNKLFELYATGKWQEIFFFPTLPTIVELDLTPYLKKYDLKVDTCLTMLLTQKCPNMKSFWH